MRKTAVWLHLLKISIMGNYIFVKCCGLSHQVISYEKPKKDRGFLNKAYNEKQEIFMS